MNGEIVWYSGAKRYGFVRPSNGGAEVVFRLDETETAELMPITQGMAVHFMVRQSPEGPVACRITPGHMADDSL